MSAYTPPPMDVLPPAVRDFVQDHAVAIGIDPGYVLPATLTGLAAAIGNTAVVQVKTGWNEPSVLFAAVVAESGSAKSPAVRGALQPILERPVDEACMVGDVTIEALADSLAKNPRGVLLYRDELDGWFRSFNQYKPRGGGDVAGWLEVWNAHRLLVNRKSADPIAVDHAGVSVVGTIQPGTLVSALSEQHHQNGLAARLLWSMPPRRPKRWTDVTVSESVSKQYAKTFQRLYGMQMQGLDPPYRPRQLPLSVAARELFARFVNDWGERTADLDGPQAAASSKLEAYAARLALVLHLAGSTSPQLEREVGRPAVAAAIELVRWFAREADRVYAMLSGDELPIADEQLIQWVLRKGERATVRNLYSSGPRRWRNIPEQAEADTDRLVLAGRLAWTHPVHNHNGRPAARYLCSVLDAGTPDSELESTCASASSVKQSGCVNR
jgi:hypothetical protein